jgi:beta-lactamase regulating signal transducer with metallopeptidase domain
MIAAWMLYSVAVGALIGAAALAGDRFCDLVRAPRRAVWIGGMLATLLLSFVALLRVASAEPTAAAAGLEMLSAEASDVSTTLPASGVGVWIAGLVRGVSRTGTASAERAYAAAASYTGSGVGLAGAWAASSALLLLLLSSTLLRLRRERVRWRQHRIAGVTVLVSRDAGPALVGLVRPSIVVPSWLLGEPAERQELVVQHEEEHRRAGDHVMLAVACVTVCLLPWNVALWWMLLRTRLAVELDCDARVLRRGARTRSYGSLLLEIAARTRAFPFGAPALADSSTHLERRLIAMTETNRTPRRSRAAVAGLSALVLLVTACAADLPTAAAIDDLDVTAAQEQAERAGLLVPLVNDEKPLFVLDGVVVTEDAARDLTPEQIRSIEVVKAAAALQAYGERGAHGVVRIVTRAAAEESVAAPLGVPLTASDRSIVVERAREEALTRLRIRSIPATRCCENGEQSRSGADRVEFRVTESNADSPLIVVDGGIVSESFSLASLSPDAIERIEIVKGEAARGMYDNARAANGVILITTKSGGR